MLGMLSPSYRGALVTSACFLYVFMGLVGGYYAGRMYKTMRGTQWKKVAFMTSTLYPVVVLGVCFVLNFFIWGKKIFRCRTILNNGRSTIHVVRYCDATCFYWLLFRIQKAALWAPSTHKPNPTPSSRSNLVYASSNQHSNGWCFTIRSNVYWALLHVFSNMGKPILLPLWFLVFGIPDYYYFMFANLSRNDVLSTMCRRLSLVVAIVYCIRRLRFLRIRLLNILLCHRAWDHWVYTDSALLWIYILDCIHILDPHWNDWLLRFISVYY